MSDEDSPGADELQQETTTEPSIEHEEPSTAGTPPEPDPTETPDVPEDGDDASSHSAESNDQSEKTEAEEVEGIKEGDDAEAVTEIIKEEGDDESKGEAREGEEQTDTEVQPEEGDKETEQIEKIEETLGEETAGDAEDTSEKVSPGTLEDVVGQQFEFSPDEIYKVTPDDAEPKSATVSRKSSAEDTLDDIKLRHPLDDFTDQELIQLMDDLTTEHRHLGLENYLFEYFLLDYDPTILDGMDELMEYVLNPVDRVGNNQRRRSSDSRGRSSIVSSISSNVRKFKLDSFMSLSSIAEGKGPKINLTQKAEMIQKATDEIQSSLVKYQKRTHVIIRNLKCELEEFSIREAEIKESIELFEFQVITQGVDQLTQRIPAEKFIKFMEDWLKAANLQIEKLRLRLATMKLQYKKVSQTLVQRQELGENVHAVDFDQLEIENKHLLHKIEQKNNHLIEIKKINGSVNLVLCNHKNYLQKQQDDCNNLKIAIAEKEKIIEDTGREVDAAAEELEAAEERYEYYKSIQSKYTVPDVMEYIHLKGKLYDLRKNIKVWSRRKKIQDIALAACLRELRRLIGSEVDPSWLDTKSESSESTLCLECPRS